MTGFFAGFFCGFLLILWGMARERRLKKQIQYLTSEIDEILHGNMKLELPHFREGEIEVLRDEIYKMTVRLREQTEILQEDKKELAEALADISHQIRTPLTAINLMCSRLSSEQLSISQKEILHKMQQMHGKIDWLVTTLLKMSKLEAGSIVFHTENIAVHSLVEQALEPFQISAELREIEITMEGEECAAILGDRAWTQEAVTNVLKNCLEYTPEKGKIEIFWEENPLYTQISVKDSGPGIAKEDIRHLFDRFYRGKHAGTEGFGIGLSLAQMIVHRQNGVIRVKNCKEGGSCFSIRFHKGIV